MKKIFILSSLIAVTLATPSFATPTELDKKTVASKAYVDTKQDLIDSGNVLLDNFDDNNVYVPGLVAYDSTTQTLKGNQIGILDWATLDTVGMVLDDYPDRDDLVPTVAAVSQVISTMWDNMSQQWRALSWSNTQSVAINAYNSTFGNGTNNWAGSSADLINGQFLANSLALKQNKIPAGTTPQDLYTSGSVLTYTNSAGTVGEKYIIDNQIWVDLANGDIDWTDDYRGMLVDAESISNTLWYKQNILPAAWTSTTNLNSMASTGGQTIDLTTTPGEVGRRYITAGGSQPLTQKAGADNVILYINGTKTLAQYQTSNFGGTTNQNYINGALVSLELLKDVYSELNAKITNNALPTGTTGAVVTYNGTNATTGVQEFGERAVYDPANTYNASTDATKLATMASVKYVCAGYEPAAAGQPAHDGTHPGDEDYCWLWALPN